MPASVSSRLLQDCTGSTQREEGTVRQEEQVEEAAAAVVATACLEMAECETNMVPQIAHEAPLPPQPFPQPVIAAGELAVKRAGAPMDGLGMKEGKLGALNGSRN